MSQQMRGICTKNTNTMDVIVMTNAMNSKIDVISTCHAIYCAVNQNHEVMNLLRRRESQQR